MVRLKICLVHNEYGKLSGEEVVVRSIRRLLEQHGHQVVPFFRSSAEITKMRMGQVRGFFSGIYSWSSKNTMRLMLEQYKPDIVHVHNVFPLISPSILPECRRCGVAVVMTVHNYRLVCPNGLHMPKGTLAVCEKCYGGREYWCLLNNCEQSFLKSLGYAIRNYVARTKRFFLDNVTMYAALTEFQRQQLIREGFPPKRIQVVPNMASMNGAVGNGLGNYVGYIGRISPEKGVSTLLSVAANNPGIPFKAAGAYDRMPQFPLEAPPNFEFLGLLSPEEVDNFYRQSRIIVLCSTCYEGFPMVLPEAMLHGRPVISSRIGGLPEIVEDGSTGLLFEPGSAEELTERILYLWDRPYLCRRMGRTAREKALREYSPEKVYERLMAVYEKAIELGPGGVNGVS